MNTYLQFAIFYVFYLALLVLATWPSLPLLISDWLIARAKRTPYHHLLGYMNRWWLLPYSRWSPAVRIHEILRSDDDRAFHDHPWSYISIILRGRYFEIMPLTDVFGDPMEGRTLTRMYRAGNILWRPCGTYHKLVIPPGEVCTTLFITFKKQQRWGFWTKAGKVVHDQYRHPFNDVNAAYRAQHPEQQ